MVFNPLKKFKLDEIVPTEDDNFLEIFKFMVLFTMRGQL